jgi:hypothetical protein
MMTATRPFLSKMTMEKLSCIAIGASPVVHQRYAKLLA